MAFCIVALPCDQSCHHFSLSPSPTYLPLSFRPSIDHEIRLDSFIGRIHHRHGGEIARDSFLITSSSFHLASLPMDPRQQHQPHPFSRPQYSSQQHYIFHPSQHPPIPPPPYSSQPTVLKQEALLQADPFLPRQQRYDVHGGPTSTTETLNGYNIQRALQYPPKPFTPSHNPHVEQSQPRRGSYGTNVAYMNGRMEEHHTKERNGTLTRDLSSISLVLPSRFCYHHRLCTFPLLPTSPI